MADATPVFYDGWLGSVRVLATPKAKPVGSFSPVPAVPPPPLPPGPPDADGPADAPLTPPPLPSPDTTDSGAADDRGPPDTSPAGGWRQSVDDDELGVHAAIAHAEATLAGGTGTSGTPTVRRQGTRHASPSSPSSRRQGKGTRKAVTTSPRRGTYFGLYSKEQAAAAQAAADEANVRRANAATGSPSRKRRVSVVPPSPPPFDGAAGLQRRRAMFAGRRNSVTPTHLIKKPLPDYSKVQSKIDHGASTKRSRSAMGDAVSPLPAHSNGKTRGKSKGSTSQRRGTYFGLYSPGQATSLQRPAGAAAGAKRPSPARASPTRVPHVGERGEDSDGSASTPSPDRYMSSDALRASIEAARAGADARDVFPPHAPVQGAAERVSPRAARTRSPRTRSTRATSARRGTWFGTYSPELRAAAPEPRAIAKTASPPRRKPRTTSEIARSAKAGCGRKKGSATSSARRGTFFGLYSPEQVAAVKTVESREPHSEESGSDRGDSPSGKASDSPVASSATAGTSAALDARLDGDGFEVHEAVLSLEAIAEGEGEESGSGTADSDDGAPPVELPGFDEAPSPWGAPPAPATQAAPPVAAGAVSVGGAGSKRRPRSKKSSARRGTYFGLYTPEQAAAMNKQ